MNKSQNIPCPACSTSILFDATLLLKGKQFTCPNCQQSIGLASESKELVKETMEKLEKIKDKVSK